MNLQYREVFELRGGSYHEAMRLYPAVRGTEFARAFEREPVHAGETVLDIPAGGGYLSTFFPEASITPLELTAGFSAGVPVVDAKSDWNVGEFDHVICAAALHHIDDQGDFINRLISHVRPGGTVHLLDVGVGSPIGRFLDDFVGRYNGTGHVGRYLPTDLSSLGLNADVSFYDELTCPWVFDTRADMLTFCRGLFGLSGCEDEEVVDALDEYVGIDQLDDGVRLNWRLSYADLRKN